MTKLGAIPDDKPVTLAADLAARVHRALTARTEALAAQTGQQRDPARLVAPMAS